MNFKQIGARTHGAIIVMTLAAALLAGCGTEPNSTTSVQLGSIPYKFSAPSDLAEKLSVEDVENSEWVQGFYDAGGFTFKFVSYKPASGQKAGFMGVYYMPEERFDATLNPNEPPAYGTEVIRENGAVLSIAGPQDSIFEPTTKDGKNITTLYDLIYKSSSYQKSNHMKTEQITGCYVATLSKDKYSLHITRQNGIYISADIAFENAEKDSSQGAFYGKFSNEILSGTYFFSSEGMSSRRELFFKRERKSFYSGFGPVEVEGDFERLARPLALTWDKSYRYELSTNCPTN